MANRSKCSTHRCEQGTVGSSPNVVSVLSDNPKCDQVVLPSRSPNSLVSSCQVHVCMLITLTYTVAKMEGRWQRKGVIGQY